MHEDLRRGQKHWETGEYFEAHKTWEAYWHTIRKDPERLTEARRVQGMIQLAVAVAHHERGNEKWYEKLLKTGSKLVLEHEADVGIDGEALITTASSFSSGKIIGTLL